MSGKTWIIFGAAVIILFGGLVVFSQRNRINVTDVEQASVISARDDNGQIADHVFGKADSKVILVEYGDFQCPGCAAAHPRVKAVTEEYKDKIAFVYRNFPLTSIHPNARAAAAAVEAAGLQGKYWQMHDVMFERQDEWSNANATERTNIFSSYAQLVGINANAFSTALNENNARINKKINFDQALGKKDGVTGTPSFFLNGEKLTEEQTGSNEALSQVLDEALKQ